MESKNRVNESIKAWRYGEQIVFMIPNEEMFKILGDNPTDTHLFSVNKTKNCFIIQKYIERGAPRDCILIYDSGTIQLISKDNYKPKNAVKR